MCIRDSVRSTFESDPVRYNAIGAMPGSYTLIPQILRERTFPKTATRRSNSWRIHRRVRARFHHAVHAIFVLKQERTPLVKLGAGDTSFTWSARVATKDRRSTTPCQK